MGKGGGKVRTPAPQAVPQKAEAAASKRDVEALNANKRGRTASQVVNPGLLLTAPNLSEQQLKTKLG
jgi:hypothetical protein